MLHEFKKRVLNPLIKTLWPEITQDKWHDWRWQLAHRIVTSQELHPLGWFDQQDLQERLGVEERFPMSVTPYYLSLTTGPWDPVARQFLPDPRETSFRLPGSEPDPLAEKAHMPVPGLIHRYPDRALVLFSSTCAVRCRHCNRKRTWKEPELLPNVEYLEKVAGYIDRTSSIREVILSGGDPLMRGPGLLDWFMGLLRQIPHVEVLRIGTRVPVVLPMRITRRLCRVLERHRPLWINTHFNHPVELTPEARIACERLTRAGLPVSNQTVLLKGVNDRLDVILSLCQGLQQMSVRPYYLFHCDSVIGTDHFRTHLKKGIEIIEGMWGRSGGLTIPNFVVDLPHGGGKAMMLPSYLLEIDKDEAIFRTFDGKIIRYKGARGA